MNNTNRRNLANLWLRALVVCLVFVVYTTLPLHAMLSDEERQFHQDLSECVNLECLSRLKATRVKYRSPEFVYGYLTGVALDELFEVPREILHELFLMVENDSKFGRLPDRFQYESWSVWLKESEDPRRNSWVQFFVGREVMALIEETKSIRELQSSKEIRGEVDRFKRSLDFLYIQGPLEIDAPLSAHISKLALRFISLLQRAQSDKKSVFSEDLAWVTSLVNIIEHTESEKMAEDVATDQALVELAFSVLSIQATRNADPSCCVDTLARLEALHAPRVRKPIQSDVRIFTTEERVPFRLVESVDSRQVWSESPAPKKLPVLVSLSETVKHLQLHWRHESLTLQLPAAVYGGLSESEIRELFNSARIHEKMGSGIWMATALSPGLLLFWTDDEALPNLETHGRLGFSLSYSGDAKPLRVLSKTTPISYLTIRDLKKDLGCADYLGAAPVDLDSEHDQSSTDD